jgi:hypothetical protein
VVSPDGKSVLINDGALQRWDLATGKPLLPETFDLGHAGEVASLALSADGKRLASASADGSARLWDVTTGKPLRVWPNHTHRLDLNLPWPMGGATAVALSEDGLTLVSGGSDFRARVMDALTGKEVCGIDLPRTGEHAFRTFQLRLTRDGKRVVGLYGGQHYGFRDAPQPKRAHALAVWDAQTQ